MDINGYELRSIEFIGSTGPWWRTQCPNGEQALSCLFSAEQADMLMDRWRCWAQIDNPHVVRMIDVVKHQDGRCLVVEGWINGQSLEALLGSGQPPAVLADWYEQVADGLRALHDAGMVHGDITPANVVIAEDGGAVVVDVANDPDHCLGTPGWSQGGQAGMEGDQVSLQRLAEALGVSNAANVHRSEESVRGQNSVEAPKPTPADNRHTDHQDQCLKHNVAQPLTPTAAHTWRALAQATPTVMARQAPSWKPRLAAVAAALVLAGGIPWGVHMAVDNNALGEQPCLTSASALDQLNGLLAQRDQAIMAGDSQAVSQVSSGSVAQDDQQLISRLAAADVTIAGLKTTAVQVDRVQCLDGQVDIEAAIQQQSSTRCDASGLCESVPAQQEHLLLITLDEQTMRVLTIEPLDQVGGAQD